MANDFKEPVFPQGYVPSGGIQNISWFRREKKPDKQDLIADTTYLGTPVYSTFIFKAVTGINDDTLSQKDKAVLADTHQGAGGFKIQQIILEVNQSKNIVKTSIQGRAGTVKEYISDGDYAIRIQGALVSPEPLVYPKEAVRNLELFLKLKQSLEVASDFLNTFGITTIVIDNYTVKEVVGNRNMASFTIQAWSDSEFKIEASDNAFA